MHIVLRGQTSIRLSRAALQALLLFVSNLKLVGDTLRSCISSYITHQLSNIMLKQPLVCPYCRSSIPVSTAQKILKTNNQGHVYAKTFNIVSQPTRLSQWQSDRSFTTKLKKYPQQLRETIQTCDKLYNASYFKQKLVGLPKYQSLSKMPHDYNERGWTTNRLYSMPLYLVLGMFWSLS